MRDLITRLPVSKIREVANAGIGRDDVLAFWFGESDEVTPMAVREAASASLLRGETFYAHNLGLPELRQALAAYTSSLHQPVGIDRIAVTSSGVSALMIAMQALVSPGDEVVAVVPLWPNLVAQAAIMGAVVRRVSLVPKQGAWSLDLQGLLDAITPATRVLLLNAPNNPTGWTLSREEQQILLGHCRRTGTWIVADEVYERLYYLEGAPAAPSFLDLSTSDDRVIVVHSFSKSFLMTGWRLGWLVLPPALLDGVVCHAGHNTVCETLLHGLPLVVIPIAYDQSYVAARVAQVQAGIRLNFKRFHAAHIQKAVHEILHNHSYRAAAVTIQSSFEQAGGTAHAAKLLEGLAAGVVYC